MPCKGCTGLSPDNCVIFKGRLYLVASNDPWKTHFVNPLLFSVLCVFSADLTSCKSLAVPTQDFALAIYHSQLVLVGGREVVFKQITNKLWSSDSGTDWQLSLPCMPTKRWSPAAVCVGTPECLVVAGGEGSDNSRLRTVEVLKEGVWFAVLPFPSSTDYNMRFTLCNSSLYFMRDSSIYYCEVSSLLASCNGCKESSDASSVSQQLWSQIMSPPTFYAGVGSVGGHLLAYNYSNGYDLSVYSSSSCMWLSMGSLPASLSEVMCTRLPGSGEFVIIGECCGEIEDEGDSIFFIRAFKASFKISPFDSSGYFSMNALSRLEAKGYLVVTLLAQKYTHLAAVANFDLGFTGTLLSSSLSSASDANFCVEMVLNEWERSNSFGVKKARPTTWKSLFAILMELGSEELSEQIEGYMSSDTALL